MPDDFAVWFVDDYGQTAYDLFNSEADAAVSAAGYEDTLGPGSVLGLQYADGRAVPTAEWAAMKEGRRRQREFAAVRAAAVPDGPASTVRDPFTHDEVEVTCGDPAWLGLPAETYQDDGR